MQSAMILHLIAALVLVSSTVSHAYLPQLGFHHRFSDALKEKTEDARAAWPFVTPHSQEYHQFLKHRDLFRHGRKTLESAQSSVTFYSGNATFYFLGGIYYSTIELGTPSVPFLVALDTGSDLLWVPCECKACAPASSPGYQGLPPFIRYDPALSNSSQAVTCSSSACAEEISVCTSQKLGASSQCGYSVVYGTPNTSTSGTVYQDVITLTNNDGTGKFTSPVVLGCGQDQTGALVDGSSVPDGLIGLGYPDFTVPSMLAKSGLTGNSFSMCFDADLTGTIVFGDYGSKNQSTTPLQTPPSKSANLYYVQLESIGIATASVPVNNVILVDSGTSTTFLQTTVYNAFLAEFAKHVTYPKVTFDGTYELCYSATDTATFTAPNVIFKFLGGAEFVLFGGLAFYFDKNSKLLGFCVAVFDGNDQNIFAANIMIGYSLIFNRDQMFIGWEEKSCYDGLTFSSPTVGNSTSPLGPGPSAGPTPSGLPPPPTAGGVPTTPTTGEPTGAPGARPPSGAPSAASGITASLLLTLISLGLVNVWLH